MVVLLVEPVHGMSELLDVTPPNTVGDRSALAFDHEVTEGSDGPESVGTVVDIALRPLGTESKMECQIVYSILELVGVFRFQDQVVE